MLTVLFDSALRAIALGALSLVGVTMLRVRRPPTRMTVWTVVMAVSLAMPLLTPWMTWTIPVSSASMAVAKTVRTPWVDAPAAMPAGGSTGSSSQAHAAHRARAAAQDWQGWASGIYMGIGLVMLLRLFTGWVLTWRMVRAAHVVGDGGHGDGDGGTGAGGASIRVSNVVLVPVTFASTIVLPSSYTQWSEVKRRAVLLHEGSHVAHGDSYVLMLAAIYRCVFWFNPFSWWLFAHLAELAELVSDDVAIEGLKDALCYADILVEMAKSPQRLSSGLQSGLAMARPSTVQRRVERILAATALPSKLPRRRRVLIALMLAPVAALSAGTIALKDARAAEIEAAFERRIAAAPERFRDQTPISGGEAALREMIEDLREGAPNYARMSPALANGIRARLKQWDASLSAFGAVESISFKGVGPGGYDLYTVYFERGLAQFGIDVAADGTMDDLNFRPDGDGRHGGVMDCALESTLRSSHDTAPIRLLLSNRSGAELHVYWLSFDGRRVSRGVLGQDESRTLSTSITYPFVITDASGQCREIVLPGLATRVHVVEAPGAPVVRRTTPVPGSEEMLQAYIDSINRGDPNYDRMTPAAAAALRTKFARQQAILAKLGALESMSFTGVTEAGSDLYAVKFAHGSADWQIRLASEGKIADIALGPQL